MSAPAASTITEAAWKAKGRELFGDDMRDWRFECPGCGLVMSANKAGADFPDRVGALRGKWRYPQECVGRHIEGAGCDWAAFGVFSGPVFVVRADAAPGEQPMPVFDFEGRPLAPNPLLTNNPPPLEVAAKEGSK